jgi:hypothetical protein
LKFGHVIFFLLSSPHMAAKSTSSQFPPKNIDSASDSKRKGFFSRHESGSHSLISSLNMQGSTTHIAKKKPRFPTFSSPHFSLNWLKWNKTGPRAVVCKRANGESFFCIFVGYRMNPFKFQANRWGLCRGEHVSSGFSPNLRSHVHLVIGTNVDLQGKSS